MKGRSVCFPCCYEGDNANDAGIDDHNNQHNGNHDNGNNDYQYYYYCCY